MQIDSNNDLITLLLSLGAGIILSFIYDSFKSFRKVFKSNSLSVFVQDVLFSLILTLATFTLLFLRTNGTIRWFVILIELIGFIISHIYCSNYIVKFLTKLLMAIKKYLIIHIRNLFYFLQLKINTYLDKIIEKIKKVLER